MNSYKLDGRWARKQRDLVIAYVCFQLGCTASIGQEAFKCVSADGASLTIDTLFISCRLFFILRNKEGGWRKKNSRYNESLTLFPIIAEENAVTNQRTNDKNLKDFVPSFSSFLFLCCHFILQSAILASKATQRCADSSRKRKGRRGDLGTNASRKNIARAFLLISA